MEVTSLFPERDLEVFLPPMILTKILEKFDHLTGWQEESLDLDEGASRALLSLRLEFDFLSTMAPMC